MINGIRFLQDFRVPVHDTGRSGWVHVNCPFCPGTPDWHLGYNVGKDFWNCWRCGGKSWDRVAKALAGISFQELLARYGDGKRARTLPLARKKTASGLQKALLPPGCGSLSPYHRKYLEGRDFDPDQLTADWKLLGTGPGGGHEKLRIIAPVYYQGVMVAWQGRDITKKAKAKYVASRPEESALPIKNCLYGLDRVDPSKGCVVVEGITDVWRLGFGSVGTFGTEWSMAQALLLAPMAWVGVLFDSGEEAARKFSNKLCALLHEMGVPVEQLDLKQGDPGDLPQDEADAIMRELRLR